MAPQSRQPLPVQLAKASWAAPLLFVGMNVLLNIAGESVSRSASAVVLTAVGVLLFLTGASCGIAALFGLRRYGRKGILLPALLGIVLSSIMLAFVATTFFSAFERASDPQAQLESLAAALREDLPRMVDEETELTDVATKAGAIVYNYRLVNFQAGELEPEAFAGAMKPVLEKQLCEPMMGIWEAGFRAISRYSTADSVLLSELVISGEDCGLP